MAGGEAAGGAGREAGATSIMMGSAAASFLSRGVCHPLDTVKARVQAQHLAHLGRTPLGELRALWGAEGLRGMYRGFGAVAVGGTPAGIIYLSTYEATKRQLGGGDADAMCHLTAGMAAEGLACLVFVPVDVVKERLQVQSAAGEAAGVSARAAVATDYSYSGSASALRTIVGEEGLRGIYRGYGATMLSYGPQSALYFAFYEKFKAAALGPEASGSGGGALPFSSALTCACTAGALASWVTTPLDLAKMRMQVQRRHVAAASAAPPADSPVVYANMFDGMAKIYRSEGLRGLFRGAGARVIFHAPNQAIIMAVFESCRDTVAETLGDYR